MLNRYVEYFVHCDANVPDEHMNDCGEAHGPFTTAVDARKECLKNGWKRFGRGRAERWTCPDCTTKGYQPKEDIV